MHIIDLDFIYHQLKEKYNVELTTGLQLDAGFDWDIPVLTGAGPLGRFYLYDEGIQCTLDYDTEEGPSGIHWHPIDIESAVRDITEFMEGKQDDSLDPFLTK